MELEFKPKFRDQLLRGVVSFFAGAVFLVFLSVIQKWMVIGPPPYPWKGFIMPVFFGGAAGTVIGLTNYHLWILTRNLKASEEKYRSVVEFSPVTILLQCEGRLEYLNPAGLRLIGADWAEKSFDELFFPKDQERVLGAMEISIMF